MLHGAFVSVQHDGASHASTAFGYAHQAIRSGKLFDRTNVARGPRGDGTGRKPQVLRGARPDSYPVRQRVGAGPTARR